MRSPSRRKWLFWAVLALEIGLFLGWQLSHLKGFRWGRDEGIYMMRVRLLLDGYRLYRDVWTDQLPGLVELLWALFSVFGASAELGRALIVVLTAIGLFCTAVLAEQFGQRAGALTVVPVLALAPNLFWLSRAVISPDLPSISLGIASLAAVGRYVRRNPGVRTHRPYWLVLSGLALAAGLYIKATAILIIVPAGLWLVVDEWSSVDRSIRALVSRTLLWGAAVVFPLGVALALHDLPAFWDQFVLTQVASGQMALKMGPHAVKILRYLGEDNWGLAALAVAGTVFAVRRRPQAAIIVLTWLGTCLAVLLLRSPLWPSHHLIVLLPPLAVLGAMGLSTLMTSASLHRGGANVLLVAMAVGVYISSLPGILLADSQQLLVPTYQSSLDAVEFLRQHVSPGAMVISDDHMIPFRAGCRVLPQLATVSKKRIELDLLTPDELIDITREGQPEAVLLWDEQLLRDDEYVEWLKAHYVLAFKWDYHEIYLPLRPGDVQHPQEVLLGQVLRLRGYSLSDYAVDPGGQVEVSLYWQVLSPITRRYHGFVHLLTPQGERVSQRDQLAWGEQYPSSDWQVGETILDRYMVAVPDVASPGVYVLSVGLYDGETRERLEVRDAQGQRLGGDQVVLGPLLAVRGPAVYEDPMPENVVGVQFGDLARLVGYDLDRTPQTLEINLVWRALSHSEWPGHKVYVHLRNDQGLVAQDDSVPDGGVRPTFGWREGEFIVDHHVMPLDGVSDGEYALYVGMYGSATGERVPVVDASGTPLPAGEIQVGQVTIQRTS